MEVCACMEATAQNTIDNLKTRPTKIGTYARRKSFRLRDPVLRSTGRCACSSRQLAANRVTNLRDFDSAVHLAAAGCCRLGRRDDRAPQVRVTPRLAL